MTDSTTLSLFATLACLDLAVWTENALKLATLLGF
jgi:hypothetical protein